MLSFCNSSSTFTIVSPVEIISSTITIFPFLLIVPTNLWFVISPVSSSLTFEKYTESSDKKSYLFNPPLSVNTTVSISLLKFISLKLFSFINSI